MPRPITVLCALACVASPLLAQSEDEKARRQPTRAESRVIEQILDLVEEIEELVATLPPHLRDEVRERLAAAAAEPEPADTAAVDEASSDTGADAATAAVPATTETPAAADETAGATKTVAPMATATAPPTAEPVGCNALWLFDSDRDGVVGGPDRYWRHLYLWRDLDGDGAIGEDEVESAYERGVKAINVALDFFERRKEESPTGEIEIVRGRIVLDVAGDGIASVVGNAGSAGTDDGALVVDATRLARGDGLTLLDGDGAALQGFQAFRSGLALRRPDGTVLQLSCP